MKSSCCLFLLIVLTSFAGRCCAQEKDPIAIDQAIEKVAKPGFAFANMSPFKLQTYYRLTSLHYHGKYEYKESHQEAWLGCLNDENQNMYARLCAAYFLLDSNKQARDFVLAQIESDNLRHRYNAAEVVRMYVGRDTKNEWGIEVLVNMLADGSLDGSGVKSSPPGDYPLGDCHDIMVTPLDSICWNLGFMKEQSAVPALISVLQRRPATSGAAFALGEIGDPKGIPALMKVLEDNTGYEDREVIAIGKLKHKPAVPLLVARLGNPRTKFGGMDVTETEKILTALLLISDQRAIEPIENYIAEDSHPDRSKATARRVLVQLKSDDPVAALLELLETESYEPERSDIVFDLAKFPEPRVIERLSNMAKTSDSAFMRREAIFALTQIKSRESLLVLASLLESSWPEDLKAEWGWKLIPDFQVYFPETLQGCLKRCTEQDFGDDQSKWIDWIEKNAKSE